MKWYPPAEAVIPLRIFWHALSNDGMSAEAALRRQTGAPNCLFGPSGRALLYQLLRTLSAQAGPGRSEVLMPGYTCYSVAAAAVKAGLQLRFYDIDPHSFDPIGDSVWSNCGPRTLAVISQHLLGLPSDLSAVGKAAASQGAVHIEDAAQAFGASLKGQALGTFGDFGFYSFGRGKSLPLGGGGALLARNASLRRVAGPYTWRGGWQKLLVALLTQPAARPHIYWLAEKLPLGLGRTVFDPGFEPGKIPFSLLRLFAPMLAYLPELQRHRASIASIYRNKIPAKARIAVKPDAAPVYTRFPVLAKAGPLPPFLLALGVRRLYPNALPEEADIAVFAGEPRQKLEGALKVARELITLPTHKGISAATAEVIADRVQHWMLEPSFFSKSKSKSVSKSESKPICSNQ